VLNVGIKRRSTRKMNEILESNGMTQQECRLMDIDYIQPKVEGGAEMATLREAAQAYVPPQTLNIADLDKIPIDLELKDGTGKDKQGQEFKYKYAEIEGKQYRVAGTILGGIKAILQKVPNLQFVQVIKAGQGMNTRYTVIPYTAPAAPITTAEAIVQQPLPPAAQPAVPQQ